MQPRGLLGWIAGVIMANRASNRQRNTWTLDLLGIEPDHKVLEIGCGPGWGLSQACQRASRGYVVGADPSLTMLNLARKRNRTAIVQGRLKLVHAAAEDLPEQRDGPFDRIFSSNVFGLLSDPESVFKGLRKQLRTGGLIATTWLPRVGPKTDEATIATAERIEKAYKDAGMAVLRRELRRIGPVLCCCVIAQ
jgi:ubiquinone/menaquinone biosynthesis C-methylase UbiE